jgi:fermentation-respiration switch protein FrsA (DUF1100 family)
VRFFGEYFADMDSQSVDAKRSVAKIAPRAVFLMQGGRDIAISRDSGPKLYAAAGEPKVLWEEPELGHIQFDTRMPEEYERRVVGFLDQYCRP